MTDIIGPMKETGADVVPSPSEQVTGIHPCIKSRIHHPGIPGGLEQLLWLV